MSERHTRGPNSDGTSVIYTHFFLKQIIKNTHGSKVERTHILRPTILLVKYSMEICPYGHPKACQEFPEPHYSQ